MAGVLLWLSGVLDLLMLWRQPTRNAGLMSFGGTVLGLLFHYDIATVPEVRDLAVILWLAAAFLVAVRNLPGRRRSV